MLAIEEVHRLTEKRLQLSDPLEPYREVLEKTVRPAVEITVRKGQTTLHQSKFGGHPYLPQGTEHPLDENGQPMMLLAQLNFEELPHIELMPKKGILQFYIPFGDDVYGLDFDDQTRQRNFRTLYHPNVVTDESALVTDFAYMESIAEEGMVPFTGEYQLSFQIKNEAVSMGDYRFDTLTEEANIDMEQTIEVNGETLDMWDVCSDHLAGNGHKIGGYSTFTQQDPRGYEDAYSDYEILLLQIDTEYGDDVDIMWGDSGVANFFIKEEDLRNLDFSKVLYNWDFC